MLPENPCRALPKTRTSGFLVKQNTALAASAIARPDRNVVDRDPLLATQAANAA